MAINRFNIKKATGETEYEIAIHIKGDLPECEIYPVPKDGDFMLLLSIAQAELRTSVRLFIRTQSYSNEGIICL